MRNQNIHSIVIGLTILLLNSACQKKETSSESSKAQTSPDAAEKLHTPLITLGKTIEEFDLIERLSDQHLQNNALFPKKWFQEYLNTSARSALKESIQFKEPNAEPKQHPLETSFTFEFAFKKIAKKQTFQPHSSYARKIVFLKGTGSVFISENPYALGIPVSQGILWFSESRIQQKDLEKWRELKLQKSEVVIPSFSLKIPLSAYQVFEKNGLSDWLESLKKKKVKDQKEIFQISVKIHPSQTNEYEEMERPSPFQKTFFLTLVGQGSEQKIWELRFNPEIIPDFESEL